jgi:hypothetical protein
MFRIICISITFLISVGCSSANNIENESEINLEQNDINSYDFDESLNSFPDDTYIATVEYYNPNAGTSSTYTLDVEVVDNIVIIIHFNNGGWLDESHIISGGELDESGSTEIESDMGYIFTVTIVQ